MKIAILTSRYPSNSNHYAHTFVHRRSTYFQSKGYEVGVFVPSKEHAVYTYDNIDVVLDSAENINDILLSFDVVYFHLLNIYPVKAVNGAVIYDFVLLNKIKSIFYLHGSEVQSLKSRNFDFKYNVKEMLRIIYKDIYFMPQMRRFIKRFHDQGSIFITPSKWMLEEARKELKFPVLDAAIIPNGIDVEKFKANYIDNKKMLCIRPLNSNKYAVDLCIDLMPYLPDFSLDIFGKGSKEIELKKRIKELKLCDRVKIFNNFIPNNEMPELISKYSYFLALTRMDAQGVSMCEALSCSRIVISSDNTAIPEFIINGINGIIGDELKYLANKIQDINDNKSKKESMGISARDSMLEIRQENVLDKELSIIKGHVNE